MARPAALPPLYVNLITIMRISQIIYFILILSCSNIYGKDNNLKSKKSSDFINKLVLGEIKFFDDMLDYNINKKKSCTSTRIPREKVCNSLAEYPKDNKDLNFVSGKGSLCDPYWNTFSDEEGKITYKDNDYCGDSKEDRYVDGYSSPTPNDMEKQGYKLEDIKGDHFSLRLYQVKYTQKNVTDRCCEFNEDCINAMQQVEINFCGFKAKSKDSPDPCADAASYSLSDVELLILDEKYLGVTSAALKKLGHSIDSYSKLSMPEKNSILSSLGLDYKIMDLMEKKLKKNELFPGRIIISMYARKNTDGSLDWLNDSGTITHEFMHACMAIKAQQNMVKKSNFSKLYLESWSSEYCKKDRMQDWKSLYTEISDLTDGNPEFIQCLSSVADQTQVSGALNKCGNICWGSYLDEGLTELLEIKNEKSLFPGFPYSACFSTRDSSHPMSLDIYECAVQNIRSFRKKLRRDLFCSSF